MPTFSDLQKQVAFEQAHRKEIQIFKDQLLITLVKRLGGDVILPASEVDDTGEYVMDLEVKQEPREFRLTLRRKQ